MALREKYSIKKSTGNNYSSFWLDNDWDTTSSWDDEDDKPKGPDLIALASYRRAISNFVNIVTSKNIPVTFTSSGDSYTDGKKVTISSKLDDKLFDSAVGLALHEGSHILLSDFDFLKQLEVNIPKEYVDRGFTKGYSNIDVKTHIKNLLNFVEDRRIDYHIFRNAPGYKGYYHSMYDKYFRAKVVDKGLLSDEYTDENLDSYMFRIVNITNLNTEGQCNYAFIVIMKIADINQRNKIEKALKGSNIEFRRGLSGGGNQLRQPYIEKYAQKIARSWQAGMSDKALQQSFANTEHVHNYSWYIGNYPSLEKEKITNLINLLNKI